MSLDWWDDTGHISNLISSLRRAYGQYRCNYDQIKIGLTVDPETRWRSHAQQGWSRMVVIYSTSSPKYVAQVERLLIEHGWDTDFYEQCKNLIGGGGGLRYGYPRYYIYVILG